MKLPQLIPMDRLIERNKRIDMSDKIVLGVYSSKSYNLETLRTEYGQKILVSKDVIDWLEMHDLKVNEFGDKIYIVNAIEYINLGKNTLWNIHGLDETLCSININKKDGK